MLFTEKLLPEAAELFGLEVSLKTTEVLHQPAPRKECHPPNISVGHTGLKAVQQFCYLRCVISSGIKINKEIDNRLAKAAFGRLCKQV